MDAPVSGSKTAFIALSVCVADIMLQAIENRKRHCIVVLDLVQMLLMMC